MRNDATSGQKILIEVGALRNVEALTVAIAGKLKEFTEVYCLVC
jgi:hypothetical protein